MHDIAASDGDGVVAVFVCVLCLLSIFSPSKDRIVFGIPFSSSSSSSAAAAGAEFVLFSALNSRSAIAAATVLTLTFLLTRKHVNTAHIYSLYAFVQYCCCCCSCLTICKSWEYLCVCVCVCARQITVSISVGIARPNCLLSDRYICYILVTVSEMVDGAHTTPSNDVTLFTIDVWMFQLKNNTRINEKPPTDSIYPNSYTAYISTNNTHTHTPCNLHSIGMIAGETEAV